MDTTGCFVGDGRLWIETFTGRVFPLNAVATAQIEIEDIAHALSLTCRYAGHCQSFYSVAEHSVHVHDYLRKHRTTKRRSQTAAHLLMLAILHDAAEAYVGDVTRPLKCLLPEYRKIEDAVQRAIFDRFGLAGMSVNEQDWIKEADNAVLRAEAQELMHSRGKAWDFNEVDAADVDIQCWEPEEAEMAFLVRFELAKQTLG